MEKKCSTCRHENGNWCERSGGSCTGYEHWEPEDGENEAPPVKTLLDEFAKAAMAAIISKTPLGTCEYYEVNELNSQYNMTAGGAYSYAAAMMKERKLYNDDGTLKEEATEQ